MSRRTDTSRPAAAGAAISPPGRARAGSIARRLLPRPLTAVLVLVLVCGVAGWLYGLAAFIRMIPVTVADPASRTDAIVVLTGGKDRVATGLRLLADNKAERVFISGVHPGVDAARLISVTAEARPSEAKAAEFADRRSPSSESRTSESGLGDAKSADASGSESRANGFRAELLSRIDTGEQARNTAGNAAETAAWLQRRGYSSMRLVTASYHIPRSLLEFRTALPGTRIVPHPVFSQPIEPGRWWREPATALLLIKEYNKLLFAGLRLRLQTLTGAAAP
jgi:uncharacterized SAM-binding protein YcdF (DUF218 family)